MQAGRDYIGIGVGACILSNDGKIFLTLRGAKARNESGKWEIPGGSVEFGERLEQALVREIHEELGIGIQVLELLHVVNHIIPDEHQHWVSPTFVCRITDGTPAIREPGKCDAIGWFTIDEAEKLPLSIVTLEDIIILKNRKSRPPPK